MINVKKASLLAALGLVLAPAAVFAGSHSTSQEVVKNTFQNVVVNTFNNCVVTKWPAARNECTTLNITRELRTVYFDFNKSTLNAKEKGELDSLAKAIQASKSVESVDIVGFADKIGKPSYNKALSMKRAQTVKSYLAAKGLKTRNTRVEAMGEDKPVTSCDDSMAKADLINCLAEDRRVEVMLNMAK